MNPLYLIRLPISVAALGKWAAGRDYGWTIRRNDNGCGASFDMGNALHHLLAETFGQNALQPFRLFVAPRSTQASIYAYSSVEAEALADTARAVALPEALAVMSLPGLESKPVPSNLEAGRRIGFDVRLRPVSRLLKPLTAPDGNTVSKGAEIDAFLLEAWRQHPDGSSGMLVDGRSREIVYTEWLKKKLEGAAVLQPGVRMAHFQRSRAVRNGKPSEGPDVVLQGDMVISDALLLRERLASGIGRHKAYGYGMLLLRPCRRT